MTAALTLRELGREDSSRLVVDDQTHRLVLANPESS